MQQNKRGFTIVELIVVIAVIAILAAVSIVGYGSWRERLATDTLKNDLIAAASAFDSARNFGSGYPGTTPDTFSASTGTSIDGRGSVDGKSFCVNGSLPKYPGIIYSVSNNQKTPKTGTCSLPPTESIFLANGTWTKPPGAVAVDVFIIGGGGNGGNQDVGLDIYNFCGGGGGGVRVATFSASALPATVLVSVAARGSQLASSFGSTTANGGGTGNSTPCNPAGGSGGGTGNVTYGNGGNGAFGATNENTPGGSGLTGGGGYGAYLDLDPTAGGNGTYGGGGGGGGSDFYCTEGAAGGSPNGESGVGMCVGAIGGNGGNYGAGGGGAGESYSSSGGAGGPGIVKVTVRY